MSPPPPIACPAGAIRVLTRRHDGVSRAPAGCQARLSRPPSAADRARRRRAESHSLRRATPRAGAGTRGPHAVRAFPPLHGAFLSLPRIRRNGPCPVPRKAFPREHLTSVMLAHQSECPGRSRVAAARGRRAPASSRRRAPMGPSVRQAGRGRRVLPRGQVRLRGKGWRPHSPAGLGSTGWAAPGPRWG